MRDSLTLGARLRQADIGGGPSILGHGRVWKKMWMT